MKIATELGHRIRKYRKAKGFTQEELSVKCNLHPTYIGQIERGEKNPSVESIYKICRALELRTSVLFERIDDFVTGEEAATVPSQIYGMVEKLSEKEQKCILAIVQNVLELKG